MKKFYTLFIVLFGSMLFGQEYRPMLGEDNLWTVERTEYDFGNNTYYSYNTDFYLAEEVIVFNGKEYRKITDSTEYFFQIPAYIHEDVIEKKIYIYYPEIPGGEREEGEFLLYDFNLDIGDIVPTLGFSNLNFWSAPEDIMITEIRYENVFGLENVKTYYTNYNDGHIGGVITIYEGIGLSTGPITFQQSIEGGWKLYDFNRSLNLNEQTKIQTKVYPNPFSDKIQIQNSEGIVDFQLFDLQGKLISTNKNLEELNSKLSSLYNAVYFLKIQFKNNKSETIKLIKNK